jgi:imidazolonepropionase-like amidohydrolase
MTMEYPGRLLFAAACLLQLADRPAAQSQTANATLFEGARLIVGDGAAPIENSAFIVENSRFTRVGRKGQIQAPPGAVRVDLTGKTVMPAIVDTHNHLGPGRDDYVRQLNLLAYVGVSAATSMGTDTEAVFPVRAEQPYNGARLLAAGRGLVGPLALKPETFAAGADGRLDEDLNNGVSWVSTEVQARVAVRQLAVQRVDFVKLWVDSRLGTEVPMSPPVYRAVIDEAHRHNLRVFVHSWSLQDAKDLVRAGVDAFAHPVRDREVDDELIQLLKDRPNVFMMTNVHSTYLFTLTEDPAWLKDPLLLDIASPAQLQALKDLLRAKTRRIHEGWPNRMPFGKQVFDTIVRNTKTLYAAGVPYAFGTDTEWRPIKGFDEHLELEILVKEVGLTPAQAITLATQSSAKVLGLDDLGTVASGKSAAFIVLDANPLEDITNTRRISKVYLRGHEIDRAAFRAAPQRGWEVH